MSKPTCPVCNHSSGKLGDYRVLLQAMQLRGTHAHAVCILMAQQKALAVQHKKGAN